MHTLRRKNKLPTDTLDIYKENYFEKVGNVPKALKECLKKYLELVIYEFY
jgi:hypothetical protein